MEEEKKDEIEVLGNTSTIEPIKEDTAPETPVEAPIEPVDVKVEEPVPEAPVEAPVETPTEPVVVAEPTPEVTPEVAPEPAPEAAPETPAEEPVTPAPVDTKNEVAKKKGKYEAILMIIALLSLAFFAAWVFLLGGDKALGFAKEEPKQEEKKEDKTEKKEDKTEKKEETKDYSVEDAEKLLKVLFTVDALQDSTIRRYMNDKTYTVKDYTDDEVFFMINRTYYAGSETIPAAELEKKVSETLYERTIEHKEYSNPCFAYKYAYNAEEQAYKLVDNAGGCGFESNADFRGDVYKVLSAKVTGENLTIEVGTIFGRLREDNLKEYYLDYQKTKEAPEGTVVRNDDGSINYEKTSFTDAAKYVFNFKKVHDTYAFVSSGPKA